LLRELTAGKRELRQQQLELGEGGSRGFFLCGLAGSIGAELRGAFDLGHGLSRAGGWFRSSQCIGEDLIDLRARYRPPLALAEAIPGGIRLLELPALGVGELALTFDLVEGFRHDGSKRLRLTEVA